MQVDGQHPRKLAGLFVGTFHKRGIVVVFGGAELAVGIAVPHKAVARHQTVSGKALPHLADAVQLGAGNDGAGLIHHTQGTPHRFFHLKDNALKHSVCHNMFPLFRIDQRRRGTQDAAAHNAPFPAAGAPWLRGTSRADLPIFVTRSYFSVLQTARL